MACLYSSIWILSAVTYNMEVNGSVSFTGNFAFWLLKMETKPYDLSSREKTTTLYQETYSKVHAKGVRALRGYFGPPYEVQI